MSWIENISRNRALVAAAGQPELAVIVSGSAADRDFWGVETEKVKRDIFRADGKLQIASLSEDTPAGNFLGTLRAWIKLTEQRGAAPTVGVSVMSMVFGQGKRFSPFTQALGNRKAAFPTPLKGERSGAYLRTSDIAILYSSLLLSHLSDSGFSGVVVKWGDEAIIPSVHWTPSPVLGDVDIVRFVWKTTPTDVLAREKEWWVLNESTGLIERLIPRQPFDSLRAILRNYGGDRYATAVNLGSIGLSYRFLDIATRVFGPMATSKEFAADWDPIVNLLLLLDEAEDPSNDAAASSGLRAAEASCPGLTSKIRELRAATNTELGRPLRAGYVEYGDALWIDLGLHTTLFNTLAALTRDDDYGRALRAFFALPERRDRLGNIVVNSRIDPRAHITDSVILDSEVGATSEVANGVVVGSKHGRVTMPMGGASLFSVSETADFDGPRGVAFRCVEPSFEIPEGGRRTTFFATDPPIPLVTNESVQRYDESEYSRPILGNRISFENAARLAASVSLPTTGATGDDR